jgi:predicted transglutaminase-like cysteine proteinase
MWAMRFYPEVRRWILPAIVSAMFLCGCASFQPPRDAAAVPYRIPKDAKPAAYNGFADKYQVQQLRRATFPRLNEMERTLIREINRDVNEDIRYLGDYENYGLWDFAVVEPRIRRPVARGLPAARYGDCEDYALTKKKRLTERGMHPSRLFIVRAKVPTGEGIEQHVVLAVPEGSEWWILNNWGNRIEPASHLVKWWDWNFVWPRYDDYRRLVRARNGNHYGADSPRRG